MSEVAEVSNEELIEAYDGSLEVHYEYYAREMGGDIRRFTHKSKDVLKALVGAEEKHSYGDGDADGRTALEVLQSIGACNGDGCDFIFSITTGGKRVTLGDVDDFSYDDEEDYDEDDWEDD